MQFVDQEELEGLQEICESAGVEWSWGTPRGMSHEGECVVVKTRTEYDTLADLIDACQGDIGQLELLTQAMRGAKVDQMGMGVGIYFTEFGRKAEEGD